MTDISQIRELVSLGVDYAGMIFYDLSPRNVADKINPHELRPLSSKIKLTGVFVNPDIRYVKETIHTYQLNAVQLCGEELPDICEDLRRYAEVLKVIHVDADTDLSSAIREYQNQCDCFLFDTKTEKYGGSGKKFSWEQLTAYSFPRPFFLSGGISVEDADAIQTFRHPDLVGVDINSRFELAPGLKDLDKIKTFVKQLSI